MRLGVIALMLLVWADQACGQSLRIGIIDVYGLRQVTQSQAREALKIKEGDAIITDGDTKPDSVAQAEGRLSALPGVLSGRINLVCCDDGRAILYVGIEERGTSTLRFRAAPRGSIRLPGDVMQAGQEFFQALMRAVQSGDAGEDDSKGHALMHDPTVHAIQERFIVYAARDLKLRDVLRHSADAEHRALAAQILGYAANKRAVTGDLAYGMDDPSESVRNNAMRALALIAALASATPELKIRVPTRPFVRLLNSPVWTDRNKASLALMALSKNRDPELIASLREHALASLIEMARWKSEGHAAAGLWLLGRIGGLSEDAIQAAWSRGDREVVIDAALKRR
jgi:hypothetical protein